MLTMEELVKVKTPKHLKHMVPAKWTKVCKWS